MKKFRVLRALALTAAIWSVSFANILPAAAQNQPVIMADSQESDVVYAKRVTELEDGADYVMIGSSRTDPYLVTGNVVAGPKVATVFEAATLASVNLADAENVISTVENNVFTVHLDKDANTVSLQHKVSGKYVTFTVGERPAWLAEEEFVLDLHTLDHASGGTAFAFSKDVWFFNHSVSQNGFSFYYNPQEVQDENFIGNQFGLYKLIDAPAEPEETCTGTRASAIESGSDYLVVGYSAKIGYQIVTPAIVDTSGTASLVGTTPQGLDAADENGTLTASPDYLWTIEVNEDDTVSLKSKTEGKYITIPANTRPVSLSDTATGFTLKTASHFGGGTAFALCQDRYYLNYSDSKGGFCAYDAVYYKQDETHDPNQFILFKVETSEEPEVTTVQAQRTSEAEDGQDYVLVGWSEDSGYKILTASLNTSASIANLAGADPVGLNIVDEYNVLNTEKAYVWTLEMHEDGTVSLKNKELGQYLTIAANSRPVSLSDTATAFTLKTTSHKGGGTGFAFCQGTYYLNYSDSRGGFCAYEASQYEQDETHQPNQFALFKVTDSPVVPETPDSPVGSDALANLVFLSDFQTYDEVSPYTSAADVPESLRSIIRNIGTQMINAGATDIDSVLMCGDYSAYTGQYNYDANPTYGIQALESELDGLWPDSDRLFIQGNHDLTNYPYDSGPYEDHGEYVVYAINTMYQDSTAGSFPWYQGSSTANRERVQRLADNLKAWLDQKEANNDDRPVIIMCHVPLHFSGRTSSMYSGDNMNAGLLFDVINEAGKDQDIIFLFGHNHSNGWDSYLGGSTVYLAKGDTILIPDESKKSGSTTNYFTEEELNFTYLNAGYIGYWKDGTADSTLTATLCQIYSDRIELIRFDQAGVHDMGSVGNYNTKYDDSSLIPSSALSAQASESPQVIPLTIHAVSVTLEDVEGTVGSQIQVQAVTSGIDSSTIEWTLSDDDAFEVTGVSNILNLSCLKAGSYTVTYTAKGKDGSDVSESATITVAASTSAPALTIAGADNASYDIGDKIALSASIEGATEIKSVEWSCSEGAELEGEELFARNVTINEASNVVVSVKAEIVTEDGSPQRVEQSVTLVVETRPEYVRTLPMPGENDYLIVSVPIGQAINNSLTTTSTSSGSAETMGSTSISGYNFNDEDDKFKGEYDNLLWTIKQLDNGKYTIKHKESGLYLNLSSSSRSISFSQSPVELTITAGSINAAGQGVAINNGSMFLNYSKNRPGFTGYDSTDTTSNYGIDDPNNQFILYSRELVLPEDIDRAALLDTIAQAEAVDSDQLALLKAEDEASFQKALEDAKSVSRDEDATQEDVDQATNDLKAAMDLISHPLDFTYLDLSELAASSIPLAQYKSAGKTAFTQSRLAAQNARSARESQEAIDKAALALNGSMLALRLTPKTATLEYLK